MDVDDSTAPEEVFANLATKVDEKTGPAFGTRSKTGAPMSAPTWTKDYQMGMGRRRRGGNRCSKYFKFLLKGILVTAGSAIVWYGGAAATGVVGEAARTALLKINEYCTVGPFAATGVQTGVCGLVYKLQYELISFFATQDYGTIKAMLTGGVAVVGTWSLWGALKGAVSGTNAIMNTMVDDFCDHYFAQPTSVAVAVQTEAETQGAAVGADAAATASDAGPRASAAAKDAAAAAAKGQDIRQYLRPRRGGRKSTRKTRPKKMGKSRRARRSTARTPLFLY